MANINYIYLYFISFFDANALHGYSKFGDLFPRGSHSVEYTNLKDWDKKIWNNRILNKNCIYLHFVSFSI